jgi:hypothetical protein
MIEEAEKDELYRRVKWIVYKNGGFSADGNNITIVSRFWVIAHMTGRIDVRVQVNPSDIVYRIDARGFVVTFEPRAIEALEDMRKYMVLEDLAGI